MRKQKGQTLIEILLAFSVSIVVLSAIVVGVVTSISNTQYTKNQGLANSYAQEGMSVIRGIRDSDWIQFSSYAEDPTKYCISQNPINVTVLTPPAQNCNAQSPVGEIFSRDVKFDHLSPDCSGGSKVTVTVSWSDSKCPVGAVNPLCHKVELITCLSNLDLKPTP